MMINKCPQLINIIVCDSDTQDLVTYLLSFTVLSAYVVVYKINKVRKQLFDHIEKNHQDIWDELDIGNYDRFWLTRQGRYDKYFREGKHKEKNDIEMNDLCEKIGKLKFLLPPFVVVGAVLGGINVFLS